MNPDTSKGLYVTDVILAQAHQIEKNKAAVAEKKKKNAEKAEKDRVENRDKRRALYEEFVQEYGGKTLEAVDGAAQNGGKLTGNMLMAIFQHLGGRPKDLDDTKKATVLAALRCNPQFLAVVENTPTNESNASSSPSDDSGPKTPTAQPTNSVSGKATKNASSSDSGKIALKTDSSNDSDKTGPETASAAGTNESRINTTESQGNHPQVTCTGKTVQPLVALDGVEIDRGDVLDTRRTLEVDESTQKLRRRSLQQYGRVVSIPGDGNCGYHATYFGLQHLRILPGGMGMSSFRRELFDFASDPATQLVLLGNPDATPPIQAKYVEMDGTHAYPTFREEWFKDEILKRIWKSGSEFDCGAKKFHWMDARFIPPIVALKYNVPVVVYGKQFVGNSSYYCTTMFQPFNGVIVRTDFEYPQRPCKKSIAIIHNGTDHFSALEPFN
jgi:hypothetical protein